MMTWSSNKLWRAKTSTFGLTFWRNKTAQLQMIWSTIRHTSVSMSVSTATIATVAICVVEILCSLIRLIVCHNIVIYLTSESEKIIFRVCCRFIITFILKKLRISYIFLSLKWQRWWCYILCSSSRRGNKASMSNSTWLNA